MLGTVAILSASESWSRWPEPPSNVARVVLASRLELPVDRPVPEVLGVAPRVTLVNTSSKDG
jgi:hypothetical protein